MLPPLAPNLLDTNPHFANLYKYLTSEILEADGSTKANKAKFDGPIIDLEAARGVGLKHEILVQALREIAVSDNGRQSSSAIKGDDKNHSPELSSSLSQNLRELVYMISSYLSESIRLSNLLPSDVHELMAEEVEAFRHHLPQISESLSNHLIDTDKILARVASASNSDQVNLQEAKTRLGSRTNLPLRSTTSSLPARRPDPFKSSSSHPPSQSLQNILTAQRNATSHQLHSVLPSLLASNTSTALTVLDTQSDLISRQIRHLELFTHGTQSRHLLARAGFLRNVAEGLALKTHLTRLSSQKDIYADTDMVMGLEDIAQSFEAEQRDLADREARLMTLLEEYKRCEGGEERMRVLGERYRDVERDIELVKEDIERLEKEVGQ